MTQTVTGHRGATAAVLVVGGGGLAVATWIGGQHGLAVGLVAFYAVAAAVAGLALLSGDGWRNEAMRKSYWPALRVEHGTQVMDAGRAVSGEAHVVIACPHHLHWSVNGFRN